MNCNKCGAEIQPGAKFCRACGSPVETYDSYAADDYATVGAYGQNSYQDQYSQQSQNSYQSQYSQQDQYSQQQYSQQDQFSQQSYVMPQQPPQKNVKPNKMDFEYAGYSYKPISAWGYFGYSLLFSIPLVGFILLIVFSVGGTKNINLRNFARSHWCALILGVVLTILMVIIALAAFGGFDSMMYRIFGARIYY